MLNRRFTPYFVAVGILALLSASYLGYKKYQNYVEFEEFMSQAMAFQRSLDKDTQPDVGSADWQTAQRGGTLPPWQGE